MRGKRIGEVRAQRRENFTEKQENWVQKDRGDRGCYSDVGYLANAAGGFVMRVGMRVRGHLQEEEKR
jgi:hypothetical protein